MKQYASQASKQAIMMMTSPSQSLLTSSCEGSPTLPASSAASSQFFFDRRGSAASTAVASTTETLALEALPKSDKHHLEKLTHEQPASQQVEVAHDERESGRLSRKHTVRDLKSAGKSNADEADATSRPTPPSHGRLLPLRKFLLCYACLAIAVFLTALDQTIGERTQWCT